MTARYVVLRHSGVPEPHFDLMFDLGPAAPLATWRSPIWPIEQPTTLTRLADHRREYLTYEGEITGERGTVQRVAEGICDLEMAEGRWSVRWGDGRAAIHLVQENADRWNARR